MSFNIKLCSLFKVRHVIGCIKHGTVGLGSKILMRLSYYIQLAYGNIFSTQAGIEPGTFQSKPRDQGANLIKNIDRHVIHGLVIQNGNIF